MANNPKVACPGCGKQQVWSTENPWRPFCSERCKKIDLGAWASEAYRIPAGFAESDTVEAAGDHPSAGAAPH